MPRVRIGRDHKRASASSRFLDDIPSPQRNPLPAAKDSLQRRNQELTVLNAVVSAASRHLELKTVLDVTLKKTLGLMRAGGGVIYLYDKPHRTLALVAHRGFSPALLRELEGLRLGESFSGAIAASRKALVIPDVRGDARAVASPRALLGLRAYAGVPILCCRKVLGVFALMARQTGRFASADVALLGRIAAQVGVAIENARLYEEARRELAARKQAEAALQQSEERFRVVFERAPVGIALVSFQGRILHTNPAFQQMLGYTAAELRGKSCADITHPDEVKSERRLFRAAIAGRRSRVHVQKRYVRKDGRIIWADLRTSLRRDAAGKPLFVIGMIENITERRQAEERLETYQKRLRSLASQLALTEERERRRVAVALHDEIGQTLSLARIKLGELADASTRLQLAGPIQAVHKLILQALKRTRGLTFELSPPVLYELKFCDAIGWLVEEFQKRHPMRWEFRGARPCEPLQDDVRVTLFQGVREVLFNVVKHARAKTAKVRVESAPGEVRVHVEDDGVGFAADELWSDPKALSGFGLFSVRERLESLGGRLEIDSRIGGGTRVTLAAPLASSDGPSSGDSDEDHDPAGR